MREAKTALAAAVRCSAKAQNKSPLRTSRVVYWIRGKPSRCACRQECGRSLRSLVSALICWNRAHGALRCARSCLR
jgi:hypothetical protein